MKQDPFKELGGDGQDPLWPGKLQAWNSLTPPLPDGDWSWAQSRAQDIYLRLKEEKFEVYFPGQHVGTCTSPYVVVKQDATGRVGTLSSTVTYYDILCYVPREYPAKLQPFMDKVKIAMKKLWPMIAPTYEETAPFFDNEVGGYMSSIIYRNYKYIEGGR